MPLIDIEVGNQRIFNLLNALDNVGLSMTFLNTQQALYAGATRVLEEWRNVAVAHSSLIPNVKEYIRGIKVVQKTPLRFSVVSESSVDIERDRPEWDMKPSFLRSSKARQSSSGSTYLIIPFRHNVTTLKKHGLYQEVRNLGSSSITGYTEKSRGNKITGGRSKGKFRQYKWSGSVKEAKGPKKTKVTTRGDYTWKSAMFQNLRKMDTSVGEKKSSAYMTFRTVSSKSDPASWIYPAKKGFPIRKEVVSNIQQEIIDSIKNALKEDLNALSSSV